MAEQGTGEALIEAFTGGVFAENCYLVRCARTGAAILVDPGAAVGEMLVAAKQAEARIEAIVLTHAHLDHVEGLARAKRETGAPILLHAADDALYAGAPTQAQWFGLQLDPLPPVDGRLVEGGEVSFGDCTLRVRHTPGHAPGHVILIGDGFALVGDVIFRGSIGRTDLPGGNLATLMNSIRTEVLTLPEETVLYNGHGPETTVGHERRTNPFITGVYGGSNFA